MESKKSWFSSSVLRMDLYNGWPIWGLCSLVWLILLSLVEGNRYGEWDTMYNVRPWESFGVMSTTVIGPVYGFVVALWLFRALYQSRSAIAIHSLPVTRTQLYLTHMVSALIYFAIPAAVISLGGMLRFSELDALAGTKSFLAIYLVSHLWAFALSTFSAMLGGQILAVPILYGVFSFAAVVIFLTINALAESYLLGYVTPYSFSEGATWLTPWLKMEFALNDWTAAGLVPQGWKVVGIYSLAALALLVIGFFLYRSRQLEKAGEMLLHLPVKIFIRYLTAVFVGLFGGVLVGALFGVYDGDSPLQTFLMIAAWAAFGLVIEQLVERRSFRVLDRAFFIQYLGVAALVGGTLLVLHTGGLGYEMRIPKAEQVAQVNLYSRVYCGPLELSGDYFTLDRPEDIQAFLDFHAGYLAAEKAGENQAAWDAIDQQNQPMSVATEEFESDPDWESPYGYEFVGTYVNIKYQMKQGSNIRRNYMLPIMKEQLETPGCWQNQLEEIFKEWDTAAYLERQADYVRVAVYEDNTEYQPGSRNCQRIVQALAEDIRQQGWENSLLRQKGSESTVTMEISSDGSTDLSGFYWYLDLSPEDTPNCWEVYQDIIQ